jgi:hypothetical protein
MPWRPIFDATRVNTQKIDDIFLVMPFLLQLGVTNDAAGFCVKG